jgi:Undecaprenyl-phosphate glucose phosphotransferase
MREHDLIHFSPNKRAALAALGECGIATLDAGSDVQETRSIAAPPDRPLPARPAEGIAEPEAGSTNQRRAHQAWSSLRILVVLADLIALIVSPTLCHLAYFGDWVRDPAGLAFIEVSCILTWTGLKLAGAYTRGAMQRTDQAWSAVLVAQGAAVLGVICFGFISRAFDDVARLWIFSSLAGSAALLLAVHSILTMVVSRIMKSGYLRERVAIVCAGPRAKMVLEKFRANASPEVEIVGIFDDRKDRVLDRFEGYGIMGNTDSLLSYVRLYGIDRIIITIPWSAEQRILKLVAKLRQIPVRVDLIPDKLIWEFPSNVSRINGVPIVTVANNRVDQQMDWLKRVEDLALSALLLLPAAPLMLLVAIAIRLDSPGPILFRQKRSGFNNEIVEVYKFRSMYVDRTPDPAVKQATKNDPRVTRIGRILRKTSIDELPQLFNVVMGQMSLVGPRPHALPHNYYFGKFVDGYFARHNVKPGITGWAQVNGYRGETDTIQKMSDRVRYDLEYIERWSLMFDLKIIFLTTFKLWLHKTAY